MKRRSLLATLISAPACCIWHKRCGAAESDEKAEFVWHLPSDQLGTAQKYLGRNLNERPEPNSETDTRGFPLLLIVSAVAVLPQLAEAVIRVYRGFTNGGVLITSKGGTLQILTDRRLPPDMVVVQSAQGVNVYQAKGPSADDLLSPLKSILKGEK
jgi:hypothetical protein